MKYNQTKILYMVYKLGVFTEDSDPSDQGMFIVERKAFKHLCESLVKPCSCHFSGAPWKLDNTVQVLPHMVMYTKHKMLLSLVFYRKDMFCELFFNVDVAIGLRRGLVPDIYNESMSVSPLPLKCA